MAPAYDIFLRYSMKDEYFVRTLVKALGNYNISVKYNHDSSFKDIHKGFQDAYFGIIVISQNSIIEFHDCIDELVPFLSSEIQMLHPVWLELSKADIKSIEPRLACCDDWGIESPPETAESIARQLNLKLAGSFELQKKVFCEKQIQYTSPKLSTVRSIDISSPYEQTKKTYLDTVCSKRNLTRNEECYEPSELVESTDNKLNRTVDNDDFLLSTVNYQLREAIAKRLDCYLKGLSNWKQLAKHFTIDDQMFVEYLSKTGRPTMFLFNELCARKITMKQFKEACEQIQRHDVIEEINRFAYNEIHENLKYYRE